MTTHTFGWPVVSSESGLIRIFTQDVNGWSNDTHGCLNTLDYTEWRDHDGLGQSYLTGGPKGFYVALKSV